jgi:hypothetical protein
MGRIRGNEQEQFKEQIQVRRDAATNSEKKISNINTETSEIERRSFQKENLNQFKVPKLRKSLEENRLLNFNSEYI